MAVLRPRMTMTELLLQPDVLDRLRLQFRYIQENLTTTIHEASDLTSLTDAQLRYAESKGMLSPNRAEMPEAEGGKGQRRYTAENLLRAHLIAYLLDKDYSFSEIGAFMRNNPAVIQDVLQTSAVRLKTATEAIDAIQYSRFVVPRMLYYALSLIFERYAVANVGLIVPVRADPAQLAQLTIQGEAEDEAAAQVISTPDDLGQLGQLLLAWRPANGPMITIQTSGNPFEREQRVIMRPLATLLPAESPQVCRKEAAHIFIAFEPQAERELEDATRALNLRQSRGQNYANSRVVAARLITQAQLLFGERMARAGDGELEVAKTQLYAAPDMINPMLGDALLNQLTETLIELGGRKVDKPEQKRWRFACILTPSDPYTPLKYQALVVRAQSSKSPHRINVTTTAYEQNGGLTFRAFSSGRIIYRPEVTALDPAISYYDVEQPIESAVAAPTVEGIGGGHGQPPAVIYITSDEPDAFQPDDFLLIRVIGRLVGEIVLTYNSRWHHQSTLTDALVKPEIVDPFFAEFPSDSDFTRTLAVYFKAVRSMLVERSLEEKKPFEEEIIPADEIVLAEEFVPVEAIVPAKSDVPRTLMIVGFDINNFTSIQAQRGNQVARILTREVGQRAKLRMESGFSRVGIKANLYLSYADRFIMLIRDEREERLDAARAFAERIREDLDVEYFLEGDQVVSIRSRPTPDGPSSIALRVRMAGMTFTRDDLVRQFHEADGDTAACVASIARLIDDGLRQAVEERGLALWWNSGERLWAPPA